jgi:hypothetical protein
MLLTNQVKWYQINLSSLHLQSRTFLIAASMAYTLAARAGRRASLFGTLVVGSEPFWLFLFCARPTYRISSPDCTKYTLSFSSSSSSISPFGSGSSCSSSWSGPIISSSVVSPFTESLETHVPGVGQYLAAWLLEYPAASQIEGLGKSTAEISFAYR